MQCKDEYSAVICENGQWNEAEGARINCVSCKNDTCYMPPICMTVLDTGAEAAISIATNGSINEEECNGTCGNGMCEDI